MYTYPYTRHTLCLIYFLKYTYFSILVKWVVNWLVCPTVLKGRDLILSTWNPAPLQSTIAQLSWTLQSTGISGSLRGGIWPYCLLAVTVDWKGFRLFITSSSDTKMVNFCLCYVCNKIRVLSSESVSQSYISTTYILNSRVMFSLQDARGMEVFA